MAPPAMSAWSPCPRHGVIAHLRKTLLGQSDGKELLKNSMHRLIRNPPEEKLNRPFPTEHQTIGQ